MNKIITKSVAKKGWYIVEEQQKVEASTQNSIIIANSGVDYKLTELRVNILPNLPRADEVSVASFIIIESLLSCQSKIDSRIDKVDATIAAILQLL